MDVSKILAELRQERSNIEGAIVALERLFKGVRRRGRKPDWMKEDGKKAVTKTAAANKTDKRRGRPPGSKNKPKEAVGVTPITEGKVLKVEDKIA